MTTIVVTILVKTRKTTDHPAVTVPLDDLQNIRESTTPNLHDVARESIADRGHVTPERETTVVGEGGGIEIEIVQVSAEVANTREKTKRRKRRSDVRVLVVGLNQEMKKISHHQTFLLEK